MLAIISMMIIYTAIFVRLLTLINLWIPLLLKDTILWFCFSGASVALNYGASHKNDNIFKKIVLGNIKIVIILEFIVNTFTFSFLMEFILVPIIVILMIVISQAKSTENHHDIVKLLNNIISFMGIVLSLIHI